jgi:CubicO group peptidase (beta-lactamase class C family)
MRPISALAADVPGARPDRFGSPLEIPPQSLTTYGLVIDGIHYTGECATRFGTYPYCEVMDLPSYSLSKSMVGAMAMMHLAVAYPNIPGERIADWVPSCAKRDWQGVTFKDALSMATGHYRSPVYEEDENGPDMAAFFIADTHAAKLEFACSHYPRRAPPGEQWVYHTSDSYLLGTALGAFYRSVKGATADFYSDIFVDSLWRQLHLSPVLDVPRRTYDASRQPFTGYGLTLHRDDVAKIGVFLNVDHGRNSAGQELDAGLLNAALQRDPDSPGLRAGKDELRYNLGFWAWNAQRALKCSQPAWIPFMSGYGGILVALLPNGMIYYYFSDGGVYLSALGIAEANRIRPICGS